MNTDKTESEDSADPGNRAEAEVKRLSQWLLRTQRISKVGGWASNLKTGEVWVSPEARRIYGAGDGQLTIQQIQSFPLPQDRPMLNQAMDELVAHGKPYDVEFQITRGTDGAIADIHSLAEYNAEESTVLGVIEDITERKRAEETLAEKMLFIESLVNLNPGILYIYDLNNRNNTYCNGGIQKILGYSAADVQAMGDRCIPTLMHPDDLIVYLEKVLPHYAVARDGEMMTHAYRMRHKDREWRWLESIEAIYLRNPDGSPRQIFGVAYDVTDRVRAEESLRISESRYRALFTTMKEGFALHEIVCDENGNPVDYRYIDVNSAFEQATGIPRSRWIGNTVREVIPNIEDYWIKTFGEVALTGEPIHLERYVPALDRHYEISAYSPQPRQFAVITTEITERKRTEKLLLESEKLRTVAGLAAGVAHEINNPLAGMVQNAQVILNRLTQETPANQQAAERSGTTFPAIRGFVQDREIADMLESIRASGRQASRIVQNLLAYSRRDQGTSSIDLAKLVERTLELAASDYELKKQDGLGGVEIVREYSADAPATVCNENQMQQVLLNLLRNAVQAMRANPPERHPRLCLRTRADSGSACIEVEDNGPGIAPEHRSRIFEPFFSTKPIGEGTGLGLFVCYHIVTVNHGGRLEVDSAPGGGARFSIHLPRGEGKGDAQ